jgi:hypothetical protein
VVTQFGELEDGNRTSPTWHFYDSWMLLSYLMQKQQKEAGQIFIDNTFESIQ